MRRAGVRWTTAGTVILLLAASPPAAGQAVIGGDWRAEVAAFAERVVAAGLVPGMAVAVAADEWVVWSRGFGSADLRTGRPVTSGTPFYIASSTKSLTASAAVLAAGAGDLDLDAPMVRYLPDARLPDGVDRHAIRVRDLLTLTHGLSGSGPVVLRTAYTGEFTRAGLLELLRHHEPTGRRGSFDYNNLGYNLLGMVLESIYDESWKDVVRRLVLDPLRMTSTTARVSELDPDRLALPHRFLPDGFARREPAKKDANLHAAGGHFATAADLARYLAAHQSGGRVEGERLLPGAPLESTRRLHVPQDREFGPFHRHGWGYGWDLGTFRGDTLVHRFGGFAGYRSHVSFMPARGIGVVVLVNGGGPASPAADLVATYVYERMLGEDGLEERYGERLDSLVRAADRSRRRIAEHLEERAARMAPLAHPIDAYAGVYESPVLGRMEWRTVAGGLEVRIGALHSRAEVFEASTDRLRVELGGTGQVAAFEFGPSGRAESVTLAGVEFRRVEPGEPSP